MGVNGLLPLLKSIHRHQTLKVYAGQTLGVDAFGWLHRGAVACALQLALDKPTTQYVSFCINRVRMLLDFGITPYLVFDGDSVPSKSGTNAKRRKDRDAAKELGMSLYRSGRKEQAFQELQKAVTVTPQMTHTLIEELRRMNVQILVAPYEADAQLAYLEKEGIIDGIISEDSDLLVFGAKKLITKLDQYGSCIEINRAEFMLNRDISFAGWSDTMFRRMAILSGCDYLPSVGGVGLKKGHEFVKKHKEITRIVRWMALNGKYVVPQDYLDNFYDAERAFLHHRVFCPKAGKLVFLNPLPPDLNEDEMPFLGVYVEPEVAIGVACGDLNPKTKEPFKAASVVAKSAIRPPALQENRRQTLGGADELKPKRSIDNFFQPSRRPLAELDPNCLTPSPSQQRVLERNRNASWEPRYVSSAPQLRRAATDFQRSTPNPPTSSTRSSFLAKASALSTYKPVKRQRLCSESEEVSPSKEIKQSKFFSPNVAELSPLVKKTRDRRSKKATIDIFSDDSVEEILLNIELPQCQSQVVTYPGLPTTPVAECGVTEEEVIPQSSPIKAQVTLVDSQSSHGTVELQAATLESQESQCVISEDKDPQAFNALLDHHIEQLAAVKKVRSGSKTFNEQSPEAQKAALMGLVTPGVRQESTSHEEEFDFEPEAEELLSPPPATKSKFQSLTRTFACQSPEMQSRALQSLSKLPAISNIIHTPAPAAMGGSEDAILFSSQDEVSEVEDGPRTSMNLSKYQYVAS